MSYKNQYFNTSQNPAIYNHKLRDYEKPQNLQVSITVNDYIKNNKGLVVEEFINWGAATQGKHTELPYIIKGGYNDILKLRQYLSDTITKDYQKYYPNIVLAY